MAWQILDKVKGIPPSPRYGHSATVVGSKIYCFGGSSDEEDFNDDLYVLDLDKLAWSKPRSVKGTCPSPRAYHTATLISETKILIFGGQGSEAQYGDVIILDTSAMQWSTPVTSGEQPADRFGHTATAYNNKLYLIGGVDGETCISTISVLDLDSMEWSTPDIGTEEEESIPCLGRSGHTATLVGNRLFVFGGQDEDDQAMTELFSIDLDSMEFYKHVRTLGDVPSERWRHTATLVNNSIVFFGGFSEEDEVCHVDSVVLDTELMQWQRTELAEFPELGRGGHAAGAVGDKLYIIGGTDGNKVRGDVWALDLGALGIYDVPASTIVEEYSRLLNQKEYSDFTIVTAEGTPIHAHKAILFGRCPHFANVYRNGGIETQENTIRIMEPYPVVRALLEFLYTDRLDQPVDVVADLLMLADMYLCERLKKLCSQFLHRNITVQNAAKIFHRSVLVKVDSLKTFSLHYISEHYGAVAKSKEFRNLAQDRLAFEELFDNVPDEARLVTKKQRCAPPSPPRSESSSSSSSDE